MARQQDGSEVSGSTWGGTQRNTDYMPKRTQDWFNPLQHFRHTANMLGAEAATANANDLVNRDQFRRAEGDPNHSAIATSLGYREQGLEANRQGYNQSQQTRQIGGDARRYADMQAGQQDLRGQAFQSGQQINAGGYMRSGDAAAARNVSGLNQTQFNDNLARQYAALGGVQAQANQGTDTTALRNFYQQGPGPSAAQAQLMQSQDASMGQALALARSGRNGTNPAAERQAMFQNAATNAQTNQSLAGLRAQEEANWRTQQLGAMNAEQQAQAQGRQSQLAALGMQQQALGNIGGQQLTAAQADQQLRLQGQQLNDQTALGYGGLANQTSSLGLQGALGYGGLANQQRGMGNQYDLGMQSAANQQQGFGVQQNLGFAQLGESVMQNEADRQALAAKQQADLNWQAQQTNLVEEGKRVAGNKKLVGDVLSIFAKSDVRDKTNIAAEDPYGLSGGTGGDASGGGGGVFGKFAQFFGSGKQEQKVPDDLADDEALGKGIGSMFGGGGGGMMGGGGSSGGGGMMGGMMSDQRSKERIRELETELSGVYRALGGKPATAGVASRDVDTDALDEKHDPYSIGYGSRAGSFDRGGFDLRPARGYSYEYKNPSQPGAAPGRQYGPMAQDLERTPAGASTVHDTPTGKVVDPARLTMVNTGAISETQRRQDELERELEELKRQKSSEFEALGGGASRPKAWAAR